MLWAADAPKVGGVRSEEYEPTGPLTPAISIYGGNIQTNSLQTWFTNTSVRKHARESSPTASKHLQTQTQTVTNTSCLRPLVAPRVGSFLWQVGRLCAGLLASVTRTLLAS